ncbi:hypothetical protein G7Y89_g2756 [Cudoniella acicularis]|uniref:Uncharacterized protein n=1 Tax=Cudoniella acicularis TaxID=354080 RepID=A0A8H4RUT0_9HELO|nr:hypothetical protein G7Y89_g2756 [Cudoniella acicularis]
MTSSDLRQPSFRLAKLNPDEWRERLVSMQTHLIHEQEQEQALNNSRSHAISAPAVIASSSQRRLGVRIAGSQGHKKRKRVLDVAGASQFVCMAVEWLEGEPPSGS